MTGRRQGDVPRCEFCRAPIVWAYPVSNPKARTPKGINPPAMPLDREPDPEGCYTIYSEAPSPKFPQGRLRVGELTRGQAPGWRAAGKPTYQRHYRTCPKKDDWGKPGKPYGSRTVQK